MLEKGNSSSQEILLVMINNYESCPLNNNYYHYNNNNNNNYCLTHLLNLVFLQTEVYSTAGLNFRAHTTYVRDDGRATQMATGQVRARTGGQIFSTCLLAITFYTQISRTFSLLYCCPFLTFLFCFLPSMPLSTLLSCLLSCLLPSFLLYYCPLISYHLSSSFSFFHLFLFLFLSSLTFLLIFLFFSSFLPTSLLFLSLFLFTSLLFSSLPFSFFLSLSFFPSSLPFFFFLSFFHFPSLQWNSSAGTDTSHRTCQRASRSLQSAFHSFD